MEIKNRIKILVVIMVILITTAPVNAIRDVMEFGSDAGKVDYITHHLKNIKTDMNDNQIKKIEDEVMKIASTIEEKQAREEVYNRIADRKARYKLSLINIDYMKFIGGELGYEELDIIPIEDIEKILKDINDKEKDEIEKTHLEIRDKVIGIEKEYKKEIEEETDNIINRSKAKEPKESNLNPNKDKKMITSITILVTLIVIGVMIYHASLEENILEYKEYISRKDMLRFNAENEKDIINLNVFKENDKESYDLLTSIYNGTREKLYSTKQYEDFVESRTKEEYEDFICLLIRVVLINKPHKDEEIFKYIDKEINRVKNQSKLIVLYTKDGDRIEILHIKDLKNIVPDNEVFTFRISLEDK